MSLENISIKQLRKKKRNTSIIVRVLIFLHAACMTIAVMDSLGNAAWGGRSTLVPGLVLITVALPFIYHLKNIKSELKHRED